MTLQRLADLLEVSERLRQVLLEESNGLGRANAGNDVFTWNSFDLYGTNQDELVVWNSFLDGKLDVAAFTAALTKITDAVYNDSSVTKVVVK